MIRITLKILLLFFLAGQSSAQHDNRYDPFDWVMYRQLGAITSVTEGFRYFYIGTEMGGVVRIQSIGHQLDEPITQAQGLKSNHISAVYFDRHTGSLWVIAGDYIHSSHSREGDWDIDNISYWGLPRQTTIMRMGSSQNYVWVHASSGYVKLDHISGIFLGTYTFPDEENIQWNSSTNFPSQDLDIMSEYSLSDGWLAMGQSAVNPYGTDWRITTFFQGKMGDVVAGMADGTIFVGNNSMKYLDPITAGIGNNDVQFIMDEAALILGGRQSANTHGLTYFYTRRDILEINSFNDNINLTAGPYYCAVRAGDEIWYGGNDLIAVYDEKDDFWRTLDETRGFKGQIITSMVADSEFVWVASSSGIFRLDQQTKRINDLWFEKMFDHIFIYDLELVNDQLWIATNYDLSIVDLKNNKLMNQKTVGSLGNMKGMENLLSGFKVIERFKDEIMVSTKQGVWSFDLSKQEWFELLDASVYAGYEITDLVRTKKFIFLATNDGFIRYDLKDRFIRDYHYDFIGQVYDMKLRKKHLWLGTSNGLIKFKWTKD